LRIGGVFLVQHDALRDLGDRAARLGLLWLLLGVALRLRLVGRLADAIGDLRLLLVRIDRRGLARAAHHVDQRRDSRALPIGGRTEAENDHDRHQGGDQADARALRQLVDVVGRRRAQRTLPRRRRGTLGPAIE